MSTSNYKQKIVTKIFENQKIHLQSNRCGKNIDRNDNIEALKAGKKAISYEVSTSKANNSAIIISRNLSGIPLHSL